MVNGVPRQDPKIYTHPRLLKTVAAALPMLSISWPVDFGSQIALVAAAAREAALVINC